MRPGRFARRSAERGYLAALERLPARALPSGWLVGPPDFVGVGAQKCGTTWWHDALCSHPAIHEPPHIPKERHYFDRFWRGSFTDASVERYHRLFPRPAGAVAGEWTPRYLYDPWTPELLARAAPQARVLVLLRDPVERFRSGLAAREGRLAGVDLAADAFARGLYGAQLDRLLAHVPRDRLLVLQYERCRDRPDEELSRTLAFLGLEDFGTPAALRRRVKVTPAPKLRLDEPLLGELRRAYRADSERLFDAFPELDPGLWTTLAL